MKKYYFAVGVFIFSFLFSLGFAEEENLTVCIRSACVEAEIADTPLKQQVGLMFRKHLAFDKGMFFIFEKEAPHAFWMKNTVIPLDIIWISTEKQVVSIVKSASPCQESCKAMVPNRKAKFVLEVNSGFCDKYKIRVGDKVRF